MIRPEKIAMTAPVADQRVTFPGTSMIQMLACAALLLFSSMTTGGETVADAIKMAAAKDYDGARKVLEAVVSQNGSNTEARYYLSRLLANHYRDYDAAEEMMEATVEKADGNAEYHFFLGAVYGAQAQQAGLLSKFSYAKKTRDQFVRAVELQPDSVRYRAALLSYYLQAPGIVGGGVDKARIQAEEILKRDAYEGHMALAGIENKENQLENAEKEYRMAIAAKPAEWRPHHLLGYLYVRMKRADDAVTQFKEYVRLAPMDPNSYDSLADGYLAKDDTDDALKSYLQALSVDPHFPSSVYGAGNCYETKGMKAEALKSFQQYLAENPKGPYADKAKDKVEELSK
jgi:tetratricopeptide (TPR) repeat protein